MAKNTPEDKYCGLPESYNTEKNQVDLDLFDNSTISFETKKNYISQCEAEALAQNKIVNSNGVSRNRGTIGRFQGASGYGQA